MERNVMTRGIARLIHILDVSLYPCLFNGITARQENPITGMATVTKFKPYQIKYMMHNNTLVLKRISPMAFDKMMPRFSCADFEKTVPL
jgi:hypothetical protein